MSELDTRRFVARDRNWQPKGYTPDYKTTIARSPSQALVSIPQSLSETTGPDFTHLKMGKYDNDLLLNFNHGGLPVGERVIMCGRVIDQYGNPVPHTLVEMWQANAGGRYRHKNDSYLAPLDPNFGGVGRTLTDANGYYYFRTVKPGPYPWRNGPNEWRPSHIHVSISGPSISTKLITQMYFEGDPLIPKCPIVRTIANPDAIETLIGRLDLSSNVPMDCLAYRFNIVLRGQRQTCFENQ